MKILFYTRGFNVRKHSRQLLEQPIEQLQDLVSITRTAVVLERRREDAPAFRAFVSLAVPGPDIHAEARDHTLKAAWLKVTAALRKQIEKRKAKQLARIKSTRRQPIFKVPWSRGGFLR
jgi:ribosome-associated translation inhibitor RaiA